jgi:hypothetical protein
LRRFLHVVFAVSHCLAPLSFGLTPCQPCLSVSGAHRPGRKPLFGGTVFGGAKEGLASIRAAFRQVWHSGAGVRDQARRWSGGRHTGATWKFPQSFVKPKALKRLALNISGGFVLEPHRHGARYGTDGEGGRLCRSSGVPCLVHGPLRPFRDEVTQRADIHVDAGSIESAQIGVTILDANSRPRVTTGSQHCIHERARHTPLPSGHG